MDEILYKGKNRYDTKKSNYFFKYHFILDFNDCCFIIKTIKWYTRNSKAQNEKYIGH